MNINERISAFRSFAKDSSKTSSVLGDSSLDSYITSLTKYEMACVVRLLCGTSSIFEVTSPDAIQGVLSFFRSQKDAFASDAKLTAHYRDMASYVLKYLEFVCYESGVSMPSEDTTTNNAFSIGKVISNIQQTGLLYNPELIKRFAFSLLAKPFVILSGLSGSGKTQLALAFAHTICQNPDEQICIVPVGADWTNREPLLGYVNALAKDDYVMPESGALQLILKGTVHKYGDQPHVRPFGVSEIINGRIYIMTGKVKDVYKQIAKNGKFDICALKKSGSEWMRLSGTLANDDNMAVLQFTEKRKKVDKKFAGMKEKDYFCRRIELKKQK